MNLAGRSRFPWLRTLAGLALVGTAGACTYEFAGFEGLSPPLEGGGPTTGGSAGVDAGKDASATGGKAGQGGSAGAGGSGQGGSGGAGAAGGGSGGATGGAGGATGGSGGATGGAGGTGGSGASAGSGGAGSGGKGGSGGTAGSGGTGGSGGTTADASTGGSGGVAGAAGNGGSTGGTGGTTTADASDVNRPPDAEPDNRNTTDARADASTDAAADAKFDCAVMGGIVYQQHCYYAKTVATDWNTANTTSCEAPAHLVTITSAGEQSVVAGLLSTQDRWIGLRRPVNSPQMESSFYWVTSEPLSYRNWEVYSDADREPNYTGECVRMRFTSMWADVVCTEALAVICEHD